MRTLRRLILACALAAASLLVLVACDDGYHKDIASICNAEALSGNTSTDPSEKATTMAIWLKANLKSKRSIDLMRSLATMTPESRKETLNAEAVKAGLSSCPMADAE